MSEITLSPAIEKALADLRQAIVEQLQHASSGAAANTTVNNSTVSSVPEMPMPQVSVQPNIPHAVAAGVPAPTSNPVNPFGVPNNAPVAAPASVTPTLENNHIDEAYSTEAAAQAAASLPDLPIPGGVVSPVTPLPTTRDQAADVGIPPVNNVSRIPSPVPTPTTDVAPPIVAGRERASDNEQPSATTNGLSKANSLLASVRKRNWSSHS